MFLHDSIRGRLSIPLSKGFQFGERPFTVSTSTRDPQVTPPGVTVGHEMTGGREGRSDLEGFSRRDSGEGHTLGRRELKCAT